MQIELLEKVLPMQHFLNENIAEAGGQQLSAGRQHTSNNISLDYIIGRCLSD